MDIATRTVTTRTHVGTMQADEVKALVLAYAKKQAGAGDLLSSKVEIAADGSVTVELVEEVHEGRAPEAGPPPAPSVEAASAPRTGLTFPTS